MKVENYSGRDIQSDAYLIRQGASKKKSLNFRLIPIDFSGVDSVVFYESQDNKHHVIWDYRTRELSDQSYNKIIGNSHQLFYEHQIRPKQIVLAVPIPNYRFTLTNLNEVGITQVSVTYGNAGKSDNFDKNNMGWNVSISFDTQADYMKTISVTWNKPNASDPTYNFDVNYTFPYVEGEPNPAQRHFFIVGSDQNAGKSMMAPDSIFYSYTIINGYILKQDGFNFTPAYCAPDGTLTSRMLSYLKGGLLMIDQVGDPDLSQCDMNFAPRLRSPNVSVIDYSGAKDMKLTLGNSTGVLTSTFRQNGIFYTIDMVDVVAPIYTGDMGYYITAETSNGFAKIPVNFGEDPFTLVLVNSDSNFSVYSGNTIMSVRPIQLIKPPGYCIPTSDEIQKYVTTNPMNYIYAMNNSNISQLTLGNCDGTVITDPTPPTTPPITTPPTTPPIVTPPITPPPPSEDDILWTVYNYSGVQLFFNGQSFPVQDVTTFKSPGLTMSNGGILVTLNPANPIIYVINSMVDVISLTEAGDTIKGRMITLAGNYCDVEGKTNQKVYIAGSNKLIVQPTTRNCEGVPTDLIISEGFNWWILIIILIIILVLGSILAIGAVVWKKYKK